ncbi:MAG: DUF4062 domain-containing protein [Clostridia bacterium]|nr:DUF4062 domain-containing protein [Clostridia bacterium]
MKLVFVSSTFKDMQFERDALHNLTAPAIDERLLQYGEKIYFGDLRWGVNTTALDSEDGSVRVLSVCLDEIDDCKPYMIVLIGERYGWIPDGELIRRAASERGIAVDSDISVTQLEIEYGALAEKADGGRVLFYFRELDKSGMTEEELADYSAETELHRQKVELLKRRISEQYPDKVRTYTAKWDAKTHSVVGLEGFLGTVENDLCDMISEDVEAENSLPWQERAMRSAHRYFTENEKNYCPVERREMGLFNGPFIKDGRRMLFISGEVGSGKTAYLSHLYGQAVREYGEDAALPFVLGLDKYSSTVMDYFKILLYKIEERAGFSHYECEYGTEGIDTEVIKQIFSYEGLCGSEIHSFIDNCSFELQNALSVQLLDSHIRTGWFDYFNSNECQHEFFRFSVAYSASEADVMLPPWFDYSQSVRLSNIKPNEIAPFVSAILKRKHKELDGSVICEITKKKEASSPTYLGLVVERLLMLDSRDFAEIRRMGDGMENINKYQLSLIERLPDTARAMTAELVKSVGGRVNYELVMRTLALLVYSGVTLSEEEIREMFLASGWEFSSLDFALATRSLTSVIKYNPREKTYSVENPEVRASAIQLLAEGGFDYVANRLLQLLEDYNSIETRFGEAKFNASAFAGEEELISAITVSYPYWTKLPKKLDGILKLHGAEYTAGILCEVVRRDRAQDWGYLIERIPTICTTNKDYCYYYDMVKAIVDEMTPTEQSREDVVCNSFFTVAWCKLIQFKMRVNASDAAPFFYAFYDDGLDSFPINSRARLNYEITRLRFVGKEAYQTMSPREIDFDLVATDELIDSEILPRADEEYVFRVNLNSALIYYAEHSFDLNYYDPDFLSKLRNSVISFYETLVDNLGVMPSAITSDDISTMIDTVLGDKGDYSSISRKRLCTALDFMYKGQTFVDSRLNKYLPHILEASRFSFDAEEWEDDEGDPVNLYKRIVAYSRAVAGTSITVDECLNAAINMGYAVDVLVDSEDVEWEDFADMLSDLRNFINICLRISNGDARVLYRLYMPINSLFSAFRVNGLADATSELAATLDNFEVADELAPLLPTLFIRSLILAYADSENGELRTELREIRDTVNADDAYARHRVAYTPELMYIDINLRTEEEIEADNADFNFSFGDSDSDWEDVDGDGDTPFDLGEMSPDAIRAMLEAQGIDTSSLPDDFLLTMMQNFLADTDGDDDDGDDGIFDLDDGEGGELPRDDEEMQDIGMTDLDDLGD